MPPADFYATRQGAVASRILRDRLALLWPSLAGQTVLGFGFSTPYLRLWREARVIAAVPGPADRPPVGCCVAEEDALPFADGSFDRVLLVHGLEAAERARRMLREMWRVLRDDGRLLVVAPNRLGWWAYRESTPFGHGQPYSAGQLARLLEASMFRVERRDTALYVPPVRSRVVLRGADAWEAGGRTLVPSLAGVVIAEAVKDAYAALPRFAPARRRVVTADA